MIEAVRAFNEAQRPRDTSVEAAPGVVSERRWLPLDAVGLCVPSGRAPLPSSLVMTAVPALVAGVRRIAVVTPNPSDAILVAARELGIDELYAVGGAQAVAALAYGTETIVPVDAIVGPGSAYVTAAKLLVSSRVRIDLPAGPSEVVVVADGSATPDRVAADLLAQAEHGPDSEALLLTERPRARRRGRVARRRAGEHQGRAGRDARRGDRAVGVVRARAPRAPRRRSRGAPRAGPERRLGLRRAARPSSATTRPARRTSCRRAGSPDRPAGSGSRRS